MSKPWPMVKLGEVLSKSDEWIPINPDAEYSEVTIRLWGKGVVLRRTANGSEISAQSRLRVRTGQFILSRIDARNGAMGIVPPELDRAVVSTDFPAFHVNTRRMMPEYLGWISKTADFIEDCRRASEGTTNRVRLQESKFLSLEIPLPPLAEQQRIVAKIDQLAAKIEEARSLRRHAAEDAEALLSSEAENVFGRVSTAHTPRTFGSLAPHVTSGPRSWAKRYPVIGYRFYRAQDIGPDGDVLGDSKVFIEPPPGEQGRSAMLHCGDLMLVITGATVGRVAVFHEGMEPGFVSQHVAICRLPCGQIDPNYGLWGLRAPSGREQLLGQRYGQGKPGLNLTNIRNLCLPLPPLPEQRRIVAYLDGLQAKVDALKRQQAQAAVELEAVLPSILDKAFRGEL